MRLFRHCKLWFATALLSTLAPSAGAAELRVAVASNFGPPMAALAARFAAASRHTVTPIPGSTGKHYAQIVNGAPIDAFFAADAERPERLERDGVAVAGSRFSYARGRLVLWSPDPDFVDAQGAVLERGEFRFLAIANPRHAPYGAAAEQVLRARGLWETLGDRIVRGENIAQAYQFVASGNAELGFVAYALVMRQTGSYWDVPQTLYAPIEQQAVLIRDSDAARAFISFVQSDAARELVREFGYLTP